MFLMIKNDKEYKITLRNANNFKETVKQLKNRLLTETEENKKQLCKIQIDSAQSIVDELTVELGNYENRLKFKSNI